MISNSGEREREGKTEIAERSLLLLLLFWALGFRRSGLAEVIGMMEGLLLLLLLVVLVDALALRRRDSLNLLGVRSCHGEASSTLGMGVAREENLSVERPELRSRVEACLLREGLRYSIGDARPHVCVASRLERGSFEEPNGLSNSKGDLSFLYGLLLLLAGVLRSCREEGSKLRLPVA